MLELRPLNSQAHVSPFRRIEQRFGGGDVQAAGHASLMADVCQVHRALLQLDIVPQDDQLLIDVVGHDVEGRQSLLSCSNTFS